MLMLSGAFTRAIGTFYRVLIVRWAGAEALGLFQMVIPLLRLASTMATLRLPVALTQVTAEGLARGRTDQVRSARRTAALLIGGMTALSAASVVVAAPFLAGRWLTDPRTERLIVLLPLALVPSALTGIFRGYAEGRQNMRSTAVGPVVEQLVRVPVVLVLLSLWAHRGVEYAAAALVVGLGAGELAGLITAVLLSGWRQLPRRRAGPRVLPPTSLGTASRLLTLSLPLWAATMINTAAQMINVGMIPRRLMVAGASMQEATELYGQLTGMVMPLLYMPMLAVFPVATVLTPAIADAWALGQQHRARHRFFLATTGALAVGLATAAVFRAFPEAVPRLLYGTDDIAPLVRIAAWAAPFAFTANIFASVLYALGRTRMVLATFVVATALRLVLIYHLTADPQLGIGGTLWAIVADCVVTAALNGAACLRWLRQEPR